MKLGKPFRKLLELLRPLDLDRKAWGLLVAAVVRRTGLSEEDVDKALRVAKDWLEERFG